MIPIEADVPNARGWHKFENSLNHSEAGTENGHERQFFATHALAARAFKWRVDFYRFQDQIDGGFIGHQHRNFVYQLLENLGWSGAISQNRDLMLDERVPDKGQARECGGGGHGVESTIVAYMKEYQAVILRLTRHTREDEDALTDLLNERSRGGWEPAMMTQDDARLTVVFSRVAGAEDQSERS